MFVPLSACFVLLSVVRGELPKPVTVQMPSQPSGASLNGASRIQVPSQRQDDVPVAASTQAENAAPAKLPLATRSAVWWLRLASWWPTMANALASLSFASVVKGLCMLGNVFVQVSPYPQVRRWEQRGCTGEADAAPYVSIAFGGWQWCYYGVFAWLVTKRSGFLILVQSNFLGALLGTYYAAAFWMNCRNDEASNSLHRYLSAAASLALFQVCALAVLPAERALFLTGLVASFCSFVGAMSMLVTVPVVVRTKDSRSIPGPLVTCNLFSALIWCLCGWILADPLIIIPNIVCVLASACCLYLKVSFPSDTSESKGAEFNEISVVVGQGTKCPQKVNEFTPLTSTKQQGLTKSTLCEDGTGGTC